MEIVIIFLTYFIVTFLGTWKFLAFVKDKKWDVKSARILLAVFVGLAGFLILSVSVYFIDGEINPNKASLTLILGTVMVFITIIICFSMLIWWLDGDSRYYNQCVCYHIFSRITRGFIGKLQEI